MGAFHRRVIFNSVESALRPARDDELEVMYRFALHASHCERCSDPHSRYLAGKSLCDRGHHHARPLTKRLYMENGRVYSTTDRQGEGEREKIEVEVPVCYDASRRLLKAIERGLRIREKSSSKAASTKKPAKVVIKYEGKEIKPVSSTAAVKTNNTRRRSRIEIVDPPRRDSHAEEEHHRVIYVNRDGTPYHPQLMLEEEEGVEDEVVNEEEDLIFYASPGYQHLQIGR
ncbi:MAG: hypothetical protein M1823_005459 [Watsoniomyces obsoletus]|nr:MAG: hypothetical protein M1823_005459 [Watsoniomyces obsoletus]